MIDVLLITGLSGAGRSQAADVMEDIGWSVVDNLPTPLVERIVDLASGPGSTLGRLALVVGTSPHQSDILGAIATVEAAGHKVKILFLDASTPETLDISPGALGENALGANDGTGHAVNPVTGQLVVVDNWFEELRRKMGAARR